MPGLSLSPDTISRSKSAGRRKWRVHAWSHNLPEISVVTSEQRVFLALLFHPSPPRQIQLSAVILKQHLPQSSSSAQPALPAEDAEHPCPAHTRARGREGAQHKAELSNHAPSEKTRVSDVQRVELRWCGWNLARACRTRLCWCQTPLTCFGSVYTGGDAKHNPQNSLSYFSQAEPEQRAGANHQPPTQGLANWKVLLLSLNHQIDCHGRFPVGLEG